MLVHIQLVRAVCTDNTSGDIRWKDYSTRSMYRLEHECSTILDGSFMRGTVEDIMLDVEILLMKDLRRRFELKESYLMQIGEEKEILMDISTITETPYTLVIVF